MEVARMMDWGNGGWGAGDWVAMSAMMILVWGALLALVVWAVRSARSNRQQQGSGDRAAALLAERFARGEIDSEEFSRTSDLLRTGGSPSPRKS
jgi:putative membrane protein